MYGVIPYAIAQGAVEFPWALGQSIVYSCITYFMIHFEFTAGVAPIPGFSVSPCCCEARKHEQTTGGRGCLPRFV